MDPRVRTMTLISKLGQDLRSLLPEANVPVKWNLRFTSFLPRGFDPHLSLKLDKGEKSCFIRDWINSTPILHAFEESIINEMGGTFLILKRLGTKKPKLEDVTPHQWCLAPVGILAHMIET
ncbi:unnamed protein product [Owenia fusiformis]|uniref:Uncharacterized protein n=1 Tax=Owenia fusiformis TaxID=6347 RepID=A0A8S4NRU2_OWEFU|nr:unnamed protein product [Owenia fusiformis]